MEEDIIPPDYHLNPKIFETVFVKKENYQDLRHIALDGHLGSLHNRFLSWRIFLGILPESQSLEDWANITEKLRNDYYTIAESHNKIKTENLDPLIFNPLSSAKENPWNNFHENNHLKQLIRQDVDRCFQEKELFTLQKVKDVMVGVLFIWSKQHPELSYKQGMHELLGIIVFIAYAEQVNLPIEGIEEDSRRFLEIFNDPRHVEADIFWIFSRVMDLGIMELFNPVVNQKRNDNKKNNLFSWDAELEHNELVNQDKTFHDNASTILKRCHLIHHRLLKAIDIELYNHLERQKIEPQMYLQRYLRCMLSREFTFADTLIIWDALFASFGVNVDNRGEIVTGKINFDRELILLDFICVAMIVFVRISLLQSDGTGILRRLLKFPPVEDIHIIIALGITYKDRIIEGKPLVQPKPRSEFPRVITSQAKIADPLRTEEDIKIALKTPEDEKIVTDEAIKATENTQPSPKKSSKNKNPFADKVYNVISLLQDQLNDSTFNEYKMQESLRNLELLKNEIIEAITKRDENMLEAS